MVGAPATVGGNARARFRKFRISVGVILILAASRIFERGTQRGSALESPNTVAPENLPVMALTIADAPATVVSTRGYIRSDNGRRLAIAAVI